MKEQSLTRSFAILSIAGILAKLMSLLYVPILKSILGPEGIGIYFKVYDVFVFIYAVTNIGLQTAVSKYVSELAAIGNYKDSVRAFKISRRLFIILGTLCTAIMFLGAKNIANMSENPNTVYGIMALAPACITTGILGTYKGYLQGRNQMKPIAIASILEQFANVVVSIFFAHVLLKFGTNVGVAGGTLGTSVGALIATGYLVYVYYVFSPEKEARLEQKQGVKRESNKKILKVLVTYGFPICLSSGLQNFGNLIDMFNVNSRLVAGGFTVTEGDVLYGLLGQWRTLINVPMLFISSLGMAVFPVISKAYALKDKKSIKKNIDFSFRITYLLGIPATVGLIFLAKELYRYMYGDSYGYKMMVLGACVFFLMSIVFMQNIVLQSMSKFYFVVKTLIIGLVVKFIVNYILVANHDINIYGAIIGFYLYNIIAMILNHIKIKNVIKMKIKHLRLMRKPFIASVYMAIAISIAKFLISSFIDVNNLGTLGIVYTGILVLIGALTYCGALITMKAIKKEDIVALSPKIYNRIPEKIKNKLQ